MATLFEIDAAILECVDMDTGEIMEPERLNELTMERNTKIKNVALYVKNLEHDLAGLEAQKAIFADRAAKCKKEMERLRSWLCEALNGQKFTAPECVVSFRRSERVEVDDVDSLPDELKRVTTKIEPNKTAIAALLKEGLTVDGCKLVENISTTVK